MGKCAKPEYHIQYAAATGYDFETATKEFEQKIQGVWQVKEFVGWDKSLKAQWDGYQGDLFLFCENAWVDDAVAWFQPVYACRTATMSEIAQNEYFNIQWTDDRYENRDGILTAAVCTQRNQLSCLFCFIRRSKVCKCHRKAG